MLSRPIWALDAVGALPGGRAHTVSLLLVLSCGLLGSLAGGGISLEVRGAHGYVCAGLLPPRAVPGAFAAVTTARNVAIYSRVSTADQKTDLQLDSLRGLCLARGWKVAIEASDTASGADRLRPGLAVVLSALRAGKANVLAVWSLDRIARSVAHAVEIVAELEALGVELVTVKGELDTTTTRGRFLFHIMAAFAEMERELARERTVAGLAAARSRGVTLGRPRRDVDLWEVNALRAQGLSWRQVASITGHPLSTIFVSGPRSENGAKNQSTKQEKSACRKKRK